MWREGGEERRWEKRNKGEIRTREEEKRRDEGRRRRRRRGEACRVLSVLYWRE